MSPSAPTVIPAYRIVERRLEMPGDVRPFRSPQLIAAGTVLTALLTAAFLPWPAAAREAVVPVKPVKKGAAGDPRPLAPTRETLRRVNEFYAPPEFPAGNPIRTLLERSLPNGPFRPFKPTPVVKSRYPLDDRLKEIRIKGNTAIPTEALAKVMKNRAGEPYTKPRWDEDLKAISRLYQDQGYLVHLDTEGPKEGNVVLMIHEFTVGEVKFKWEGPESKKHARAVQEALTQKAGSLYNQKALQKDYAALLGLKLFETINPVVEVNEEMKVTITWELTAAKQP